MNEERAHEAIGHLQTAAVEMIAAARAALDVFEDLLRDPSIIGDVVAAARASATPHSQAEPGDGPSRVTRINVT